MYKFLIVGHGHFASGIKSALDLLLGENAAVKAQDLNEEITHEKFEEIITAYVEENDKLIIFADLAGGAPSQISARKILELQKSKEQYVVSGVSLSIIVEVCTQVLLLGNTEDLRAVIEDTLNNSRDTMSLISLADFD